MRNAQSKDWYLRYLDLDVFRASWLACVHVEVEWRILVLDDATVLVELVR